MKYSRKEWRSNTIQEVAEAMCHAEEMDWKFIGLTLQNRYIRMAEVAVDIVLKHSDT